MSLLVIKNIRSTGSRWLTPLSLPSQCPASPRRSRWMSTVKLTPPSCRGTPARVLWNTLAAPSLRLETRFTATAPSRPASSKAWNVAAFTIFPWSLQTAHATARSAPPIRQEQVNNTGHLVWLISSTQPVKHTLLFFNVFPPQLRALRPPSTCGRGWLAALTGSWRHGTAWTVLMWSTWWRCTAGSRTARRPWWRSPPTGWTPPTLSCRCPAAQLTTWPCAPGTRPESASRPAPTLESQVATRPWGFRMVWVLVQVSFAL